MSEWVLPFIYMEDKENTSEREVITLVLFLYEILVHFAS